MNKKNSQTLGIVFVVSCMMSSFSNLKAQDYGDAPSPYPTAIHQTTSFEWFGLGVSDEGTPKSLDTLDDGITWNPQEVKPGETFDLTFQVTSTYQTDEIVRIWIDWNQDGSWDDPVEQVVNWNGTVFQEADGYYRSVTQSIDVPSTAVLGTTYLRARLDWAQASNVLDMSPISDQLFGECEDYAIDVGPPEPCSVVVVFSDNFDDGIFHSKWTVVDGATIDDVGINEPSLEYSLRLNGHPSGGDVVESKIIDLSSYSGARLTYHYERTGGGNSTETDDDLIVEYWDGVDWIELDRQLGSGPDMTSYEPNTVFLPSNALHADFKLCIRSIGYSSNYSVLDDWFVDDMKIEAWKGCIVVFEDTFPSTGIDTIKWAVADGVTIDDVGINEPSLEYSLRLNGHPDGGDLVESEIIDLSPYASAILTYHYERTGGGESPEAGEDLIVEYWDGVDWIELYRLLGEGPDMNDYEKITISLPPEALHADFRLRILSIGNRSTSSIFDDWFVDNVKIVGKPCDINIGTGSTVWSYPMHTIYHDSRTQVIYLASEIGQSGNITALALDVTKIPNQTMNNWTIRMKHTTMNEYADCSLEATGWTVVYQNDEAIDSTGWQRFEFQTTFEYNGTDNLLVDFSHNNSSWIGSGNCRSSQLGVSRSVYARADSQFGDPLNWSGATYPSVSCSDSIPNIKLTVCGTIPPCFPSTYSTYADWVALGKPECWCAQPKGSGYQCDGDIDGQTDDDGYRVGLSDVDLLIDNWGKTITDPTLNPCADIDHKPEEVLEYRVYFNDLDILINNWKKTDADLPGDCPRQE